MAQKIRITKANHKTLKESVLDTLAQRKGSEARKSHEEIWKEVDRQVRLEPVQGITKSGNPDEDWHNAVEVGDLATASEVFTADVLRLAFGGDHWFLPHSNLSDVEMEKNQKEKAQKAVDNDVRAFMHQQHRDFALKQSAKVSLKEVAHHGAMVATVEKASLVSMPSVQGGRSVHMLSAPVWKPHSMWDCFPDTNPAVSGTRLFYDGSMIIKSQMRQMGVGRQDWMNKQKIIDNAKEGKHGDKVIDVVTMYGPIFIPRKSSPDIFIPNGVVQIANNELASAKASEWPYPNIIFTGYERVDAKDAYYFSPLMKHSPMQTLASRAANKFMDSVDLQTEPPLIYNKNAPNYADEPPQIAPGMAIPSGSNGDVRELKVGNPEAALSGLQFAKEEMKVGLGVDANRAGVDASVEQTAEEVRTKNARSEVRVIDFLADFEMQALTPFLYMQHEWNTKNLKEYAYYNSDIGVEDHKVKTKADLPKEIIFEIIGSKDVLGEQRRATQLLATTQAVVAIPGMADRLDLDEILKDLYRDAGARTRAEVYIKQTSEEDQEVIDAKILELETELQAMAEAAQQTEEQLKQAAQQAKRELDNQSNANNSLKTTVEELKVQLASINLKLAEKQSEVQSEKTEKQSLVEENRITKQEFALYRKTVEAVQKLADQAKQNQEQTAQEKTKVMEQINSFKDQLHSSVKPGEEGGDNTKDVQKILSEVTKLAESIAQPKNKTVNGNINGKTFNADIQEK